MAKHVFQETIKGKVVDFTVDVRDDLISYFIDRFGFPQNKEEFDKNSERGLWSEYDQPMSHACCNDDCNHPLFGTKEGGQTFEQVNAELDVLRALLAEESAFARKIYERMDRKANGTLAKNRTHHPYIYPWGVHWEESYCYSHPAIKAKSVSDTEIEVYTDYYKETW